MGKIILILFSETTEPFKSILTEMLRGFPLQNVIRVDWTQNTARQHLKYL